VRTYSVIRFLVLLLLATLLAACTTAPGNDTITTPQPEQTGNGIQGHALIGPTCGGPVRQDQTGCEDRPYQAEIVVLDMQGKEVARTTSDAEGAFRFDLAPGRYILHPLPGMPLPTTSDQEVEVVEGEYVKVVVNYDSGMR